MPYYKAQHEVFIRAIIRHGDQLLAYRQAYPKTSKQSAYTAAIRLGRQPHIKERIASAMRQHAQQERQRAQEREEHKQRMAEEDTLQKRLWLARVVRGEVEKQRYMQFKGRTILVHETLNPFIILAAIELDTRYEYGTNPKIILDRQFARLYERAMRPVGERWLNRLNGLIELNGLNKLIKSGGQAEKNTQNASKKLTDSKQNLRPVMHPASNILAVCNKVEGRVACTSSAVMHRAEVVPAHYIIVSDDSLDVATSDTAASKQITFGERVLRDAQNDSSNWAPPKTGMSNEGVKKNSGA